MNEIRARLTQVRRDILIHDTYVNKTFPKGHWLSERRVRCSKCGNPEGMYILSLRKPAGGDTVLTEIVDGFCTFCGHDPIWYSLLGIEPEREAQCGLPQVRKDELCGHCLSSDVIGIWRGLNPTGAECQHCGKIELPKPLARTHRRFRATFRLARMKLSAEERRLVALSQQWILKDPFAPR